MSHFSSSPCVATIGNFDGGHLGHQQVIGQLRAAASQHDLPSVAVVFEPQPREFFLKEKAPARLMRLREKLAFLKQQAVDQHLVLRFNQAFSAWSPEQFVEDILAKKLQVRHLIVGDDFRFGYQRQGDFDLLLALGPQYGFTVERTETVLYENERISSTRVRACLAQGQLNEAAALLGRPYAMTGRVIQGDQRGRTWGIPTLNLNLHRKISPLCGVFVVQVTGLGATPLPGVASLGSRPAIGENLPWNLEVHLLDFNKEVYGKRVGVEFLHKLREESDFPDIPALIAQMKGDIEAARRFFSD